MYKDIQSVSHSDYILFVLQRLSLLLLLLLHSLQCLDSLWVSCTGQNQNQVKKQVDKSWSLSSVLSIFFPISVVSLLLITQSSSITVTSRSPREMVRICMVGQQNVASALLRFTEITETHIHLDVTKLCMWPTRRDLSCPAGWQWGGERGEPECPQL